MNKKLFSHIASSLFIILVIYTSVFFIYSHEKSKLIDEINSKLKDSSETISLYFENELKTLLSYVTTSSDFVNISLEHNGFDNSNSKTKEISMIFEDINNLNPLIHSIYFVNNVDGISISHNGVLKIKDLPSDLRNRDWYKTALDSKHTIITDIYKDINTGKPCISICSPVFTENTPEGVLSVDIFLEDLYNTLNVILQDRSIDTFIVSPKGNIILSKDKSLLGIPINKTKYTSSNYQRKNVYNYSTYIRDFNWIILSDVENSILVKEILINFIILIGAGTLICICLIVFVNYMIASAYKIDVITGLNSRYMLLNELKKKSIRSTSKNILFINLKNLGTLRTEYGNEITDNILKYFANILVAIFGDSAIIARSSEEDFIVLFYSPNSEDVLFYINSYLHELNSVNCTISRKVFKIETFLALVKFDNIHLKNSAKTFPLAEEMVKVLSSKNTSFVFSTLDELILLQENVNEKLNFLKKALKEDNIVPFYQPIYNFNTKKIEKFEVLMRIRDGVNFLSPYPFILVAEKNNIIDTIDLRILKKALNYKKEIDKEDKLIFSFNLSGKVLNDTTYLNKAVSLVLNNGIKAENIIFEITETENIKDLDILIQEINEVKKVGFKFSIDDFGTGFSSINYLKRIPADYVKIDGSFVKDINQKESDKYLVKSIVNMAKAFKMNTIAEFVESKEILESLQNLHVDYAQGYYIGKPEPLITRKYNKYNKSNKS